MLGAARFVSAVQGADRWLKLALDPVQSRASDGDVLLVFKPAQLGVLVAERLEKVAAVARENATAFTAATLSRVEPQQLRPTPGLFSFPDST